MKLTQQREATIGKTTLSKLWADGMYLCDLSMKPANSIVSAALLQLPNEFAYIPRSIAFFVDEQGNRCFVVAFRGNSNITGLEAALFSQMLAITNNERSM